MTAPTPARPSKPSVGDLLRLKRLERPPEHFWPDFDRRLQRSLVQAVVCRQPWWQRAGSILWRPGLGLATAAGAFAVIFSLPVGPEAANRPQSPSAPPMIAQRVTGLPADASFAWATAGDRSFAIEILSSDQDSPAQGDLLRLPGSDGSEPSSRGSGLLTLAMTTEGRASRTVHY